jgi:hypothetical protein
VATTEQHHELVEVTITITDADGNTSTQTKEIPEGATEVATLKQELGVAEADSLFLLKDGKRRLLADHTKHNVKADDHFEVIGKGGVS